MSRNLSRIDCPFCGGRVAHSESRRSVAREDVGSYFYEYQGLLVAHAYCYDCEAQYLAWCDESRAAYMRGSHCTVRRAEPERHFDLSHRSTFNDEPGVEDMPRWRIVRREVVREPWPRCATCRGPMQMMGDCMDHQCRRKTSAEPTP